MNSYGIRLESFGLVDPNTDCRGRRHADNKTVTVSCGDTEAKWCQKLSDDSFMKQPLLVLWWPWNCTLLVQALARYRSVSLTEHV